MADRKVESCSVNASLTARNDLPEDSELVAHGLTQSKTGSRVSKNNGRLCHLLLEQRRPNFEHVPERRLGGVGSQKRQSNLSPSLAIDTEPEIDVGQQERN
jgi:hypothetical protein